MSFSVIWLPEAEDELARIWLDASDRAAVATAANTLDHQLEQDPSDVGESRPDNRRIAFEKPLIVVFRIDFSATVVKVLRVRKY
jgi:hypothetical protein